MTINLEKSLAVNAPVPEVFKRWSNIPSYTDLMPSVTRSAPSTRRIGFGNSAER